MKKTGLIIFIAVLVIIAAAVLIIALRGGGEDTPLPSPTGDVSPTVSASPDVSPETSASPDIEPSPDVSEDVTEIPDDGVVTGAFTGNDTTYAVKVDPDSYFFSSSDNADRFISAEKDEVFFEIRFISGQTAEMVFPAFLDEYLDYINIEFEGLSLVGNTGVRGEKITADDGERFCEAYIIEVGGGVVAVTLGYTMEMKTTGQAGALYDILNSLELDF